MNGEGFAYARWRLGLSRSFVMTLFGKPNQESIIRGWWANPRLRRSAVKGGKDETYHPSNQCWTR